SQKILFHGYPSEEYEVMTEDGYFLSLNRIPHGKRDSGLSGPRPHPVLIVHGFLLDGGDWVDNFPDNSLAFILADEGYDVWIGNNRGNSWSRRHLSLSIDSEAFWDFSFHEMAMYDLPAMVDFILKETQQKKLYYVGHGQGSSLGFIAFSSLPHLAKKIRFFFALAPLYTLSHVQGPFYDYAFRLGFMIKERFGTRELVVVPRKEKQVMAEHCRMTQHEVCFVWMSYYGARNRHNLNRTRLDVYLSHLPDYTSVKNFLHWGQTAKSGKFRQFDYGPRNMEKYNQPRPPYYQIENMRLKVAVWSGGHDLLTPPQEMRHLLPRLTNIVYREEFSDWDHLDHHWGLDAPQRLYRQMVILLRENP
ncbi:LIPM Lipase, partial [Sylvietta virens]|nr:LIPM Lipase [Sylvietta virens]